MDLPVVLSVSVVALVVVGILAWFMSGTILSLVIILLVAALVGYLLSVFGVLDVKTDNGLDIQFHENGPSPIPATKHHKPVETKEVFYVSGNNWTYAEAPAVCSAMGSELASYDQVQEAFMQGAEWCGYGWSQGGMALYPTQQSTWNALQQEVDQTKRTACGHPGVNGGYFDAKLKFGVNCFGPKPPNRGTTFPAPLPGTDPKAFDAMVARFKSSLSSTLLSPFNRTEWSGALPASTAKIEGDVSATYDNVESLGKRLYNDI